MRSRKKKADPERHAKFLAEIRRDQARRQTSYREQALALFPHVCGRCCREFSGSRLRELTVHHKDHDHNNNPRDGSNWENLCVYCHENEHRRYLDYLEGGLGEETEEPKEKLKHNPFAKLKGLLDKDAT